MKARNLILTVALAALFALPVAAAPHDCAAHCAAQPGDKDQACALHCEKK